ncbi:hypothetical protein OIDMADRAFT_114216 [Oidiodendron maius Zn]|uniref:Small ribosomal subunit protein mS35 mitochondrial conserved domain-containing protein n=1 Tax=Oidiodendron maius (strain Zn) TaxID=913774 RepID=A0A0C3D5P3_OIDMZ|nr:hypothetical protein OIDMADRAFT_114216 [Oidiodendron maius Zn]
MATALQGFRLATRSCKCRSAAPNCATRPIGNRRQRPFSATAFQWLEKEKDDIDPALSAALEKAAKGPDGQHGQYLQSELRKERVAKTFMNEGEDEAVDGFPDYDDDEGEDIPTLAHGELEHHREMRHYARLAAWEMPMLATLAKPFVPPSADMPLRFRYTTYMGEQHPAEKKVCLEFCTEDMHDLSPVQREKLKRLAGVRYNPETDIVKMSCEMFETQAQNKRYLGDLVDELLREAKDPTDTFEDVPLDTRHHTFKTKPKFPKEWVMTEERQKALAEYREKAAALDEHRMLQGQVVDGVQRIEEAYAKPQQVAETLTDIDALPRTGRAKGRTVAVRR